MKRVLVIAIVTLVLNGCVAVIERNGPRGLGDLPPWVRPPTISLCVLGLSPPCPR